MFNPSRNISVPYGESAPYQKDNGLWYVTVTIDATSSIERPATDDEIAAAFKPAKKKGKDD